MKKLMTAVAAIGLLAGVSAASAATRLTDSQMDKVTAGDFASARAFASALAIGEDFSSTHTWTHVEAVAGEYAFSASASSARAAN